MNAAYCIQSLARFPAALVPLVEHLEPHALRRRGGENGEAWSIVEILCHLADEEVEDFRVRLELTLSDPAAPWPGLDPEGVAVSRAYHQQNPHDVLRRFLTARRENLQWLRSLHAPDWSAAHIHPRLDAIRAGDLLASWAAHDLLHLRQITKRLFETLGAEAQPHSTGYAGQWSA